MHVGTIAGKRRTNSVQFLSNLNKETQSPLDGRRGKTLLLVSIVGLVSVCALLAWAWATINPIIQTVGRIQERRLPSLALIQKVKYADLEASLALRNALLIRDQARSASEMQRYDDQRRLAAAALESLKVATTSAVGVKWLEAVLEARRALEDARQGASEEERRSWAGLTTTMQSTDTITVNLQGALDAYLKPVEGFYEYENDRIRSSVLSTRAEADLVWWLLILAGATAAFALLFVAFAWRIEIRREVGRRDQQIAVLSEQRQTLVREVHHRIKNHLQGLLSLIENHRAARATDNQGLATLHGHVLALVGIHGLQSRQFAEAVPLGELVRQQLCLIEAGFPGAHLALSIDPGLESITLLPDHAVPVALVITELIVNAIKHGAAAPVDISVSSGSKGARVSVTNRLTGRPPMHQMAGTGPGAGLALVESLIQGIGRIGRTTVDERLTMTVELPEQLQH